MESWHEALCARPEITETLALKLATFVADRLVQQLADRQDLAAGCRDELRTIVQTAVRERRSPADTAFAAIPSVDEIHDAIQQQGEARLFSLLAARGEVPVSVIRRIFRSRQAKAIVALARHADLPPETAERLQAYPGLIRNGDVIRPAPSGRYPLSEKDCAWQLAAFGVASGTPVEPVG